MPLSKTYEKYTTEDIYNLPADEWTISPNYSNTVPLVSVNTGL